MRLITAALVGHDWFLQWCLTGRFGSQTFTSGRTLSLAISISVETMLILAVIAYGLTWKRNVFEVDSFPPSGKSRSNDPIYKLTIDIKASCTTYKFLCSYSYRYTCGHQQHLIGGIAYNIPVRV